MGRVNKYKNETMTSYSDIHSISSSKEPNLFSIVYIKLFKSTHHIFCLLLKPSFSENFINLFTMTSTYLVYIKNQSTTNNQYLFFNSKPTDSTTLGVVWSNVWVKTGGTPTPNGQQKFTVTMDNFAVCGTSDVPLGNGVSVSMSDWTQVSLANQITPGTQAVMDVVNENPAFVKPFGTESLGNSFGIKTGVYNPIQYRKSTDSSSPTVKY